MTWDTEDGVPERLVQDVIDELRCKPHELAFRMRVTVEQVQAWIAGEQPTAPQRERLLGMLAHLASSGRPWFRKRMCSALERLVGIRGEQTEEQLKRARKSAVKCLCQLSTPREVATQLEVGPEVVLNLCRDGFATLPSSPATWDEERSRTLVRMLLDGIQHLDSEDPGARAEAYAWCGQGGTRVHLTKPSRRGER